MSSDNDFADLIATYSIFATENFIDFAAITFFTYDFATTFDREVRYFWKRKFSIAAAVFLSIRYCYLLNGLINILVVVLRSNEGTEVMDAILKYSLYIPFAVFSGTRAYALCRNRLLAGLIVVLSLAPVCVNWTSFATDETAIFDPLFGCLVVTSVTRQDNIIFGVCARGPLILADVLLVIITWRKISAISTSIPFARPSSSGFSNILLWNGTLYFVTLFVLNTLHLAFTMTSILSNGFDTIAPSQLTRFTDPLTAILVYRFILDLQDANAHHVKVGSQLSLASSSESELSFVDRAIGSLGADIVPGVAAEDDYDDIQEGEVMQQVYDDTQLSRVA